MKSFVIVLAALIFLLIAACQGYRAYEAIPVAVGAAKFVVPVLWSWIACGVAGVLGILLLFARK